MKFEIESKEHLFYLIRKMIYNKGLEGFEFKNRNIDRKLKDLSDNFYELSEIYQTEIFNYNMRDPKSIMTWKVKHNDYRNLSHLLDDLEDVLKQIELTFKKINLDGESGVQQESFPDLFLNENARNFFDGELIRGRKVTKKFLDTMNNIKMKSGVYFIYNSNKKLIYIGKSIDLGSRLPQSLSERKGSYFDFALTKTASDSGVYEMYYISKLKPKLNRDGNFPDEITIELPDLNFNGIKKAFK